MIRVVLDTNILISALLSPQGPPAQVFLMTIIDPDTQLCVSGDFPATLSSTQIVTARQFLNAVG